MVLGPSMAAVLVQIVVLILVVPVPIVVEVVRVWEWWNGVVVVVEDLKSCDQPHVHFYYELNSQLAPCHTRTPHHLNNNGNKDDGDDLHTEAASLDDPKTVHEHP